MSIRLNKILRDRFSDLLDATFRHKFRRGLTTYWNLVGMCRVSAPSNGKPFTPKQKAWVDGYSAGYAAARDIVERGGK